MQCSAALGHPVQSPPQQSLWHAPSTQRSPAAQSAAAAHAAPLAPAPATLHAGVTAPLPSGIGRHEGAFAGQPALVC